MNVNFSDMPCFMIAGDVNADGGSTDEGDKSADVIVPTTTDHVADSAVDSSSPTQDDAGVSQTDKVRVNVYLLIFGLFIVLYVCIRRSLVQVL